MILTRRDSRTYIVRGMFKALIRRAKHRGLNSERYSTLRNRWDISCESNTTLASQEHTATPALDFKGVCGYSEEGNCVKVGIPKPFSTLILDVR